MKHFSPIQLFILAIALLSLVSVGLAQNDNKESPSPSVTSDTDETATPTATPDTASKDTSQDKTDDGNDQSEENISDEPTASEDDNSDSVEDPSESVDLTGLPGRISFTTPDAMLIGTPMFVIDAKVEVHWKYDSNTKRPPKTVGVCYKAPPNSQGTNPRDNCDYVISNLTEGVQKFIWDTKTQHRPGYSLGSGTGYMFIVYDADLGAGYYNANAGRVIPNSFSFTMYNSRYLKTNHGVPVGYDPSSALRSVSVQLSTLALAVTVTIILLAI